MTAPVALRVGDGVRITSGEWAYVRGKIVFAWGTPPHTYAIETEGAGLIPAFFFRHELRKLPRRGEG